MIIYKSKRNISNFHADFLCSYDKLFGTHKIFVEYKIGDYILYKESFSKEPIDLLLKRRCRNMYLDVYDVTLDTVFEIDGLQHSNYTPFFHKDIGSLDRQKTNDYLKEMVCSFFGTKFVRINNLKDIERIKS